MTRAPDIGVDVDLRNPGQFFACCGLLELASRLWPGSEGRFSGTGSRTTFQIVTGEGSGDPFGEIVRRLCDAEPLIQLAEDHEAHAQADRKPVTLAPFGLRLDWWLDSYRGGDKSELKVWAGQQTPERNFNALRSAWREIGAAPNAPLFLQRHPMTGRFGFDPSASWDALDVGFSPDEQDMPVQTAPATEILAAIGLQRCRPRHVERRRFAYHAWRDPLEICVAAAAVIGAVSAGDAYEFPVVMRNAQYGYFGWAKPMEKRDDDME